MDSKDNIKSQIIKPYIEKLESEWQELYDEVLQSELDKSSDLKPDIEEKIEQLEKLKAYAAGPNDQEEASSDSFPDMHEGLRSLKLDLRFAQRRWKRQQVSEERNRKRKERKKASD